MTIEHSAGHVLVTFSLESVLALAVISHDVIVVHMEMHGFITLGGNKRMGLMCTTDFHFLVECTN
jgi:hypothetical protein